MTDRLAEGEEIVTDGTFAIDASAQLDGKMCKTTIKQAAKRVKHGIVRHKN